MNPWYHGLVPISSNLRTALYGFVLYGTVRYLFIYGTVRYRSFREYLKILLAIRSKQQKHCVSPSKRKDDSHTKNLRV